MTHYNSLPKINILILSRYDSLGASSRVRIFQYLPYLQDNINFVISPFFSNEIINDLYVNKKRRIIPIITSYIRRIKILFSLSKFEIVWIEKEVFPYFPGFIETLLIPKKTRYFLDYDDAIFHNYNFNNIFLNFFYQNKFKNIIERSEKIFVGNQYLYDYVREWNSNVFYLYSVVNENIYKKIKKNNISKKFTIGWIGSPSTTKYLHDIIKYINLIPARDNICLVTIGASKLSNADFELVQLGWKLEDEVEQINSFDIGIMPLQDNNWEKGKCGFKLIQYMACSLPVIASPVGINKEIVSSDVGFLAKDKNDWVSAILTLMENEDFRILLGNNGRKKIEKSFSFYVNVQILLLHFLKYE